MQNFLGHDGFVWWIGVVEDVIDPETLGRCKVRVFGYHDDTTQIPTADLPWATAIHPTNTPNLYASLALGDWVFGFFLDSFNAQEPAIVGYIPTKKTPRNFNRVHTRGNSANTVCWEIANNYIEVVTKSPTEANGHITVYHATGSKIDIDSNGAITVYTSNNVYITANTISANANVVSVTSNSIVATTNTCVVTSNTSSIFARDNLIATANNIVLTANNNFTINGKNLSTIANTISTTGGSISTTGNTISTTGDTVSTSGSSLSISDSGSSLTPTAISAGLAAGLVFPTPPPEE
jgi:hypothetical protein